MTTVNLGVGRPNAGGLSNTGPIPAPNVRHLVRAGGPAGRHIASGVSKEDYLLSVDYAREMPDGRLQVTDITAEFTLPEDLNNVVDNQGGTDTSDGSLIVVYCTDGRKRWPA